MRSGLVLALATIIAASAPSSPVRAQRGGGEAELDPQTRKAQELFLRGERMFSLGRFREALEAYQAAFEAKPLPEFLFNIGQCYRNLGDYRSAIDSYRRFLELKPDAPNRASVEITIAKLEEELQPADQPADSGGVSGLGGARGGAMDRSEAPGTDREAARRPLYKKWGFWAGVAVVAAAGAATAILVSRDGVPGSDLGNLDFGR